MSDVITPQQLESLTKQGVNKSDVAIANKTLKDVNEVLKTVKSIFETAGINFDQMIKTKQQSTSQQSTSQANTELKGIATPPRVERQPKLTLETDKAIADLWEKINELDEKKTIKEFKEELKPLKEQGMLKLIIERWVVNYMQVSLE